MDINNFSTPVNRTAALVVGQDQEIKTELDILIEKRQDMVRSINRYRELKNECDSYSFNKEYGLKIKDIQKEITKINVLIKKENKKRKLGIKTKEEILSDQKAKLHNDNPLLSNINKKRRTDKRMALKDEIIQECKKIIGDEEFKKIVEKSKERIYGE